MKKIALFSAMAIVLSLSSCKKSRTCTCTYHKSGTSDYNTQITTYSNVTKKTALATCNSGTSFDAADPNKVETRTCNLN